MTREERAAHLAEEFGATKANKESAIYRACIRMATEQKAIDIDKACEWIVKNNINYTTMDGDVIPAYDVVQGLRKAMEE